MTLNDDGQERISMAARSAEFGKGGLIAVKNQKGESTIKFIGDTGSGFGQVIVPILEITGGNDVAESFELHDAGLAAPGMVVCIDPDTQGKLRLSKLSYDRTVAGVEVAQGVFAPE